MTEQSPREVDVQELADVIDEALPGVNLYDAEVAARLILAAGYRPAPEPTDQTREQTAEVLADDLARECYRFLFPGSVNLPDQYRSRETDSIEADRAYQTWDEGRAGWSPERQCKGLAEHLMSRVIGPSLAVHVSPETAEDGQANDCTHASATGIDQTAVSDPAKVWRCDHCGLRWASSPVPKNCGECPGCQHSGPCSRTGR